MESSSNQTGGLKISNDWDATFCKYLSPSALAIHDNKVKSTRINVANPHVKGQDMTCRELEIRYYGRTIEGPVTEEHVRLFAEEINELAAQGWIEYGSLIGLINLQLARLYQDKDGQVVRGQLGPNFELKEDYILGPVRYCLLFYPASRYSLDELRNRGINLRLSTPMEEGGIPPKIGQK